ncbi:MAG: sulfite exporter TauE/SafE family protein, partial [bacterium]
MHFPVSGVDVNPIIPFAVSFIISFFTSMGGVSGSFLLLPFQISFLGYTGPGASPTNLVYNFIAVPGGIYRYIREGRMAWPLAWLIIAGTLPGVFIGAIIRVTYLSDISNFRYFAGAVLLYLAFRMFYDLTPLAGAGIMKARALEAEFRRKTGYGPFQIRSRLDKSGLIRTVNLSW